MKFMVSFDSERFKRQAQDLVAKRVRPGLQKAVDYMTAFARLRLIEGVQIYLDRPTEWTKNAFAFRRAGDEKTAASVVYVQEQQARALNLEIRGGERIAGSYATTADGPLLPPTLGPETPSSPGYWVALPSTLRATDTRYPAHHRLS